MTAWTVGDLLGILALAALAITFGRLILTLRAIVTGLDAITEANAGIVEDLHAIPRPAETQMLTTAGLPGVMRYTGALEQAL